jgi:hypothetical protein
MFFVCENEIKRKKKVIQVSSLPSLFSYLYRALPRFVSLFPIENISSFTIGDYCLF